MRGSSGKGTRPELSADTLLLFKLPLLIHFEHCSAYLVFLSHQTCLQSFFCQECFLSISIHQIVFVLSYTLWIFSYKPLNVLKQTFLILYFFVTENIHLLVYCKFLINI